MATNSQQSTGGPDAPASPRRASLPLILFVVCGAPFMASLDLFVVNVAFPDIGNDFAQSSLSDLSWVLNAYVIVYAALLIPLGRWADSVGTRRVFMLGLVLFTLGSAAAAASATLPLLIAARIVQAVGAAALTPTSLGLLIRTVPPEKQATSVRLWVTSSALGAALGPLIGGLLTELSWRWVFIVNLPVGIALIVLAAIALPAKNTTTAGRVNLIGATLSAVAAGGLCLALVEGGTWGWLSVRTLVCLGVFVVAALGLVVDSTRSSAPLIPATVMRVPSFAWANGTMLLFSITFAAGLLGLSLWLQDVWGYSALQTGLAIAPGPLMVPVIALSSQRVLGRIRPEVRAAIGSLLWAIGTVAILLSVTDTPDYVAAILPGWLLAGIGVGLTLPTILAFATTGLAVRYASAGSAVINMTRQIGTVIGVSILVAILAADGVATNRAFHIAWWTIAGIAVAAAVGALRMRPRPVATPDAAGAPAPATST